ncbi:MAG: efflux RND transporter periplasmic adaptor subunit [Thermoanaerobaculia bacterium]
MKLRNPKLALLVALGFLAAAVISGILIWQYSSDDEMAEAGETIYYCPMHPTITSPVPGNCPICGMNLIRRVNVDPAASSLAEAGSLGDLEAISMSPTQQVMANVATAPAELSVWDQDFVTTGAITYDETRLAQVTSYTAGRIERLFVQFTGDTVSRGQAVAQIYSPELHSSQQEYLLAIANRERMKKAGFDGARSAANDLVESSRRRLQLLGMTDRQILEIERGGKPFSTTTIYSPVAGIVTARNAVPQQYVQAGEPLLEVADLSTVWVEADVYEKDLAKVTAGQSVLVTAPAYPGETFAGTVAFLEPVLSGQSRSNRARIQLANPELRFKPGMFVSVQLVQSTSEPVLTVPRTAVMDRGENQFVWVAAGDSRYAPRQVTVGATDGDRAQILSGLEPGEVVVTAGGFLIDSESQLRQMSAGGTDDSHDH